MADFDVSPHAPVVESGTIEIAAPTSVVWSVLTDFSAWPRWSPGVSRMRFDGPLEVGTAFDWVGGGLRIASRLELVEPHRRLGWTGRSFGLRARHVWRFEETASGSRVSTEESFEGFLARLLPGLMRKTLRKALHEGLEALRRESESRRRTSG